MPEKPFLQLRQSLEPSQSAKKRVFERIEEKIAVPAYLAVTKEALTPSKQARSSVWSSILGVIDVSAVSTTLDRVRAFLTPSPAQVVRMREHVLGNLGAQQVGYGYERAFKWVAAFAVFAIFLQTTSTSFFAPVTLAESHVSLLPTRGEVLVSVSGFWQPVTSELTLEPNMMLRTRNGEASIVFHDDGVIRLGEDTTIRIDDTSDRSDRTAQYASTITLYTGRVWVQGLSAAPSRSIDIAATYGTVSVHQGSVSLAEETNVDIEIFDRRALVRHGGNEKHLVTGEATTLTESVNIAVRQMSDDLFASDWAVQNLQRDAVHRDYIAQLQRERRAARAGIVRTSPLYPVKQFARSVREFVTIDEEEKAQVKLEHANELLDEASALLASGETEAVELTLADYRDSLLAVASGSGDGSVVHFYIGEALAYAVDETEVSLPSDEDYLIKEAVLEASASLPQGGIDVSDVQGILLVDAIAALMHAVDEGSTAEVEGIWTDMQEQIAVLDAEETVLAPEVRKEAKMLLSEFAYAVEASEDVSEELAAAASAYLPPTPEEEVVPVLTEAEIAGIAQAMKERIFVYHMRRSRLNQWETERKALFGHPDQGRILRYLHNHKVLPHGPENFPEIVRREFVRVQWEKAVQ